MPPKPSYLNLRPTEAVEYFRRKVPIPTERWNQFEAEQHDWAYTVADLTRADLLEALQWLIDQALERGTSFETFNDQFDRLIARRGWTPDPLPAGPPDWRMRILFETPIRRAYGAGRLKQMSQPDVMRSRPYWVWRHGDSIVPRPNHLALHNKAIRADHPFWKIAYPSCAYGCKCRAFSMSERQIEARGIEILENPPDPYTIAEPGFQRAPGSTPEVERRAVLQQGLDRLSPELRSLTQQSLANRGLL